MLCFFIMLIRLIHPNIIVIMKWRQLKYLMAHIRLNIFPLVKNVGIKRHILAVEVVNIMNPNELNSLIGKKVIIFLQLPHFGITGAGDLKLNKYGLYSVGFSLTPIIFDFRFEDVEKIQGENIYLKK